MASKTVRATKSKPKPAKRVVAKPAPKPVARLATFARETLLALLSALRVSVMRDETRPHLNGVFIRGTATAATGVSTDGHRLTRIDVQATAPAGFESLIPLAAVDELIKMMQAFKSAAVVELEPGAEPGVVTKGHTLRFAYREEPEQFVPFEKFIPPLRTENDGGLFRMNPDYIADARTIVRLFDKNAGLIIYPPKTTLDPVRMEVTTLVPVEAKITIVIMPMRMP